jgi:hypothetical protein
VRDSTQLDLSRLHEVDLAGRSRKSWQHYFQVQFWTIDSVADTYSFRYVFRAPETTVFSECLQRNNEMIFLQRGGLFPGASETCMSAVIDTHRVPIHLVIQYP